MFSSIYLCMAVWQVLFAFASARPWLNLPKERDPPKSWARLIPHTKCSPPTGHHLRQLPVRREEARISMHSQGIVRPPAFEGCPFRARPNKSTGNKGYQTTFHPICVVIIKVMYFTAFSPATHLQAITPTEKRPYFHKMCTESLHDA